MSIDSKELETLNRDELINRAHQLGAHRPELLTRPELRDEIIRLSEGDEAERRRARGWFGVARDLVASVVGQGLNLPDTAELIRGVHVLNPRAAPPVATVTLAEIYAAQGHVRKALDLLDEVLANEPDHDAARVARVRLSKEVSSSQRAVVAQATGSSLDLEAGSAETAVSGPSGAHLRDAGARTDLRENGAPQSTPDCSSPATMLGANDTGIPSEETSTSLASAASVANETPAPPAVERDELASDLALELRQEQPAVFDSPAPEQASSERESEGVEAIEPAQETLPEQQAIPAHVEQDRLSAGCVGSAVDRERSSDDEPLGSTVPGTLAGARARRDPHLENRLFIVRLESSAAYCAWQLTSEFVANARKARPSGGLVLRVVEVTTSWDGPETHESTWELGELEGYRRIEPKGSPSQIRTALGWLDGDRFTVLAIGSEFAWNDVQGSKLLWAPPAMRQADELQRSADLAVARLMRTVRAA